jgi:hypothetical protein
MLVEPATLDLSDVYIGESVERSFEVVNSGSQVVSFVVMNPSIKHKDKSKEEADRGKKDTFKFSTQQGRLEAGARQRISFTCIPEVAGRQTHCIIVRDIGNSDCTVTVCFTGRKKGKESSSYVRFPDGDGALQVRACPCFHPFLRK